MKNETTRQKKLRLVVCLGVLASLLLAIRSTRITEDFSRSVASTNLSNLNQAPASTSKITMIVLADAKGLALYDNDIASMKCYSKLQGYSFIASDASDSCKATIGHIKFQKHCTVWEHMMQDPHQDSWYLVLDADSAVVNFNHRLEQYIEKGGNKDVIHGLRYHSNEVPSGFYFVRNTQWSRNYMKEFWSLHPGNPSKWNGMNEDNGALHWLLFHRLGNESLPGWSQCEQEGMRNFNKDYSKFLKCFHDVLKQSHCRGMDWSHISVLPHAQHVAYDTWITYNYWSNHSFIHHALKPGTPPDHKCCKRPILNPDFPKFECTRDIAFNQLRMEWYVDPSTYKMYLEEASDHERKKRDHGWDTTSCLQNGQNLLSY